MTKPILLFLGINVVFWLSHQTYGYWPVYEVSYGAFSIMAAIIAGTFFWLWARRSTPLALGMAFGWAGAASVMAWWWLYNHLGKPETLSENRLLYVFLSIYFVGAILHLELIGKSFSRPRIAAIAPFAAILISLFVTLFL